MSSRLSKLIFIAQVAVSATFTIVFMVNDIGAQSICASYDSAQPKELAVIQNNSLVSMSNPYSPAKAVSFALKNSSGNKIAMVLTGYSSCPEETDDTPNITASGNLVEDGIVANNLLPFGTKVKIPEIYGDKVFEVQDRMNWRYNGYYMDIWFPSKTDALTFGKQKVSVEILED